MIVLEIDGGEKKIIWNLSNNLSAKTHVRKGLLGRCGSFLIFSYSSDGHDYWLSCNHFYDEKKIMYKCPHYLCYLWPQISWDFFSSSRHKRIRVHVNANKSEKERGLKGFCVRQAIKKEFLCATFHHYAICICAEWKSLSLSYFKNTRKPLQLKSVIWK